MDSLFTQLTPWHWLVLGILLFALETMGIGGFLIGIAIASLVASILAWLDLGWQVQLAAFGIMSVVFSAAYWKFFKKFNEDREDSPLVNNKLQSMVGQSGAVFEVRGEFQGKLKLGDTLWDYRSDEVLEHEQRVVVTRVEGTILVIKSL